MRITIGIEFLHQGAQLIPQTEKQRPREVEGLA